ncbi:MAG: B12-binding domain-containing radical SAM protein [Elusimicrobia bacterium]|nr:B12-binding domain-containing radical SAM protein [Elusimicrobiota bacterium]
MVKIGLIYPPSNCRHQEAFPLPNISLPVLADFLRRAGHEVLFFDLDIPFIKALRTAQLSSEIPGLTGYETVPAYLRDRLPADRAEGLSAFQKWLRASLALEKCDLYGITLRDVKEDLFILNSAALIAREIKKRFAAPVVLGGEFDYWEAWKFRVILRRYPVFDYAIWGDAEIPLLRLVEHLGRRKAEPAQAFARRGSAVIEYGGMEPPPKICTTADYAGYPLEAYRVGIDAISERYDLPPGLACPLRGRAAAARPRLSVLYRFENTCRGRCAFCAKGDRPASSRPKSAEAIVADLLDLKERGVTDIIFINPNFNNDYDFASRLCDRMIEAGLGLQWSDSANARELDAQLLRKMRRAGAIKLAFGMETASRRLLKYIRKGVTPERLAGLLRDSSRLGIWNHIDIIGGMPTETAEDIQETVRFIRGNAKHIDKSSLNEFTLLPPSPFYRRAEAFGIRPHRISHALSVLRRESYATFDETEGLRWPQKSVQIWESCRDVTEAIAESSLFWTLDLQHNHLLMQLYAALGHSRKPLIRRIFQRCVRRFKPYYSNEAAHVRFNKHHHFHRDTLAHPFYNFTVSRGRE